MRRVRVGVAAVNQMPLDWRGNLERAAGAVETAREQGVQLLCLPELCLTGYGCEDAFHGLSHTARALRQLQAFAPRTRGMIVAVGVPVRFLHGLYNSVCFLADGKPVGFIGKQHLAGDGIHYEPRWFRPWPSCHVADVEIEGARIPFGDIVLDFGGIRVGAEICEDAWVPARPGLKLAQAGCDIIINPSASHFAFGKSAIRERIVQESSRAFGSAYLYANLLGNEAGRVIYDGDCLIAAGGELLARTPRFSFREWVVTSALVDVDLMRTRRARMTSFPVEETGIHKVAVPWVWEQGTESGQNSCPNQDWMAHGHAKEEEFVRAVALGLHDYLRKSRARGFVVSLSGGADSSAVSTLAALAFQLPLRELGADEMVRRLGYASPDMTSFSGGLLDTIYQASENSGETTRAGAESVARALGARHSEWQIGEFVSGYRRLVEETLERPLAWDTDDIALQNIQARVRGPAAWMLANVRGALLLATSNRSEAAVGYATMDGDTCGSLSPIAGIDKNYLRRWLRWMAGEGPAGIGPIPALQIICDIPPTAELRPADRGQTDEGDLMPYDLLDAIERLAIRDRLEPSDVLRITEAEWVPRVGGKAQLTEYIAKFYRLWCRNQWKRERYAPSFHLDDENLDPKTWCRFPILSGGYTQELGELQGG